MGLSGELERDSIIQLRKVVILLMPGLFITIEGVEGAGKTTLAAQLEQWLATQGVSVFRTREPGGTSLGESLRQIILNADVSLCLESELLLLEAARAQLMQDVILPRLQKGETVILDRHIDSTVAYQGYGRGMDIDMIQKFNTFVCHSRRPDITILLDLDVTIGLERAKKISLQENFRDRFENEKIEFMQKIREGFLAIAQAESQRFIVLSARNDAQVVLEMLLEEWNKRNLIHL